jgi:hypothetical protein
MVRFGSFRSTISGQVLTQVIPDFDASFDAEKEIRDLLSDLSASVANRFAGLGPAVFNNYQRLAIARAIRLSVTCNALQKLDRMPQRATRFAQVSDFLSGLSEHPRDFRPRKGIGWFGNENYTKGGYVCCDSAEISTYMVALERWLGGQSDIGIWERLVLWYMIIIIHPLEDGNGRYARALSMLCGANATDRAIIGTLWIGYVGRLHLFPEVALLSVSEARIDGVVRFLLEHWQDMLLPALESTCDRIQTLTLRIPSVAERLCAGSTIDGEIISKTLGKSRRVADRLLQGLVDASVLIPAGGTLSNDFCLPDFVDALG